MQTSSPRGSYEQPGNVFVAQFIGSPKKNLANCHADDLINISPKHTIQLGIHPELISVVAAGQGHCDGAVQVSEYLGADYFHYVDCGALGMLAARMAGSADEIKGQRIGLKFDEARLHFFEKSDLRTGDMA